MKDYQKDIENAVLPTFFNEKIKRVKWGEWVGPFVETSFVAVNINDKPFVLVEIDNDILPESDDLETVELFIAQFSLSGSDIKKLGFLPKTPMITKKPITILDKKLPIITSLEVEGGRAVDYMLFTN